MTMKKMLRSAVFFTPLLVFMLAMGCCPGKGKDTPGKSKTEESAAEEESSGDKTFKIGDKVRVGECEYKVLDVIKKENLSHYKTGELKKTEGYFIEIHGTVVNKGKKVKQIENPLVAFDSKNRKYESLEVQDDYLPDAYLSLWTIDLQPGESIKWGSIFESPADGKGFKIELQDVGVKSGQSTARVSLGI